MVKFPAKGRVPQVTDRTEDVLSKVSGYGDNMLQMPFVGIPSFFRTDMETEWDKLDLALVGVPSDAGLSHRPGARYGPQAVRAQSGLIRYINPFTRVIPYELARVRDIGDVPIENTLQLDLIVEEIFAFYKRIAAAGIIPVSVGGDHSISYPIVKALGAQQPLGLIHFDAHHDTTPAMKGSRFHHGAPFRNGIVDGVIDPKRMIQIGIRDPYQETARPFVDEQGITVIDMVEFTKRGIDETVREIRRVVGAGPVYISFDVDVLDPAYAPGTGTPVVGGLTVREAMQLLHGLRGLNIVGGDVVEVSPPFDPTGVTALVGAQMMFEILCLAAEAFANRQR